MNMRCILAALAGTLAATAVAGPESFSITTAVGDGADTRTRAGSYVDTVYGADAEMALRCESDANLRYFTYVRFDLKGAVAGTIESPVLRFTARATGDNAAIGEIELWALADGTVADRRSGVGGWTEVGTGALTHRNAPMREASWVSSYTFTSDPLAQTGTPAGYGKLLGTFKFNSNAHSYLDPFTFSLGAVNAASVGSMTITGADGKTLGENLRDFLRADTNGTVTFAMRRPLSNNRTLWIRAKEHTDNVPPRIEFIAQPEPKGTIVLLR